MKPLNKKTKFDFFKVRPCNQALYHNKIYLHLTIAERRRGINDILAQPLKERQNELQAYM